MPLSGSGSGQIVLAFNDVRLAPFFSLVPANVAEEVEIPIDGRLAGKVTLAGALARPAAMTASVDLTRLRVAYRDLMLENQGPIQLRYAANKLAVQALHVKGQGTDVTARGTLGLGVPSDFGLTGSLNLALLEKVSPKNFADAGGKAAIEASLKGTLGQPDLVGAVSIQNGELQTRNLPQAIRDMRANVRVLRDRVFLDNLRATLGYTGQVSAYGGAVLGQDFMPTSANLQFTGRDLALRTPDGSATVNADLAFSGTPDASRLDGQVRVLEAKYTKDIPLTGGLGSRHAARGGLDLGKLPFVKNLALAVQVTAPDQVVVRNNLADLELKADLAVLGTPLRPAVLGRAEAVSGGKITFQDRTYVIQEGTVDFIDRTQIKPYMHVLATTTVQTYNVDLAANGTPDQLKLDLKSSPSLPQSDVLTLLATGQTPTELAQGTGGGGGAALSSLLVGQVAKGVERGVSSQGAVDVLRIQPGSATSANDSAGSLTVGKRINDKLMITYSQALSTSPGKSAGSQVTFDYTLTDNMVLKLQQDLSGQGFSASARYRIPVR
jgi:translocation and assembly module TamB